MNSFKAKRTIKIEGEELEYYSLPALEESTGLPVSTLPYSTRILIENLLRHEDGEAVRKEDITALLEQNLKAESEHEIQFTPSRVLLQDFTGVPVVADLAAMRDGMGERGGDAQKINPLRPVDLVIDHSVQMDSFARADSLAINVKLEFERNGERYEFLKWGQKAFRNFKVVPPSTGICHQINLEYLSHVAMKGGAGEKAQVFPDSLVGTDSHTTMINGLGVLGWGVGGIEAEAAMLGQPCTMLIPQVIGFKFTGQLPAGATATDLVLTVTQMLRKRGVVGKFVEYFGAGVSNLSIADRATLSNMSPEYGATVGIFPVDQRTIDYLRATGRPERAARAEAYFKAQGLWETNRAELRYSDTLELDLSRVQACMAGPSRPQDRVLLSEVRGAFRSFLLQRHAESLKTFDHEKLAQWKEMSDSMKGIACETADFHPNKELGPLDATYPVTLEDGSRFNLVQGSIVMAAITSCTNTSNPQLMIGAGLLARNAARRGLQRKPWVKTTFAPGSLAVRDYLEASGLDRDLDLLGFNIAGFGCAVCIGNSGPLPEGIQEAIDKGGIATASVLSGNRNFEARIHPSVMTNWLASPPLVVAAALAGNINVNLASDPLAIDQKGAPVFLQEIWPDPHEVDELVAKFVTRERFEKVYANVFAGDKNWQETEAPGGAGYAWNEESTYIRRPPFLDKELASQATSVTGARILAVFGDSITTDHISPAGAIGAKSPAGLYLTAKGVPREEFNSYGSRRGNHEVMVRGTFANVRIRNRLVDREGGFAKLQPEGKETTIFEAATAYAERKVPLVIFGGKEYGSGSSRDWAAKGTRLLGVRAVITESFERIHRSNLVGMGVLPLQFKDGITAASLNLDGSEEISLPDLANLKPKQELIIEIKGKTGRREVATTLRIDTPNELNYYRSGGILPYVMDRLNR